MSSANTPDLKTLFSSAARDGLLSDQAASLLSGQLGSVVIAGAAGRALEDIQSSDVTLVTLLVDASSSIASGGLEAAVRAGQGAMLHALSASREADSILLAQWCFNHERQVLHSYVPLSEAARLDARSYRGSGGTSLYDTWCEALAANVAYAQRLRDGGTPCRSAVVVLTDGEDCGSSRSASDCATLSRALLASEQFVLGFVGVGREVNFRRVARDMGVPEAGIAVADAATPEALREVFRLVSRSAIQVSQRRVRPGGGFFGP